MANPPPLPARTKAVWSPKALAVFGLLFSIIPAGILFSINYGRYGLRKQRAVWLLITILLFATLLIGDLVSPAGSFRRWFLLSIPLLWIFYLKQAALFRQWISTGGKKASVWSGLLVCGAFLVAVLGLRLALPIF